MSREPSIACMHPVWCSEAATQVIRFFPSSTPSCGTRPTPADQRRKLHGTIAEVLCRDFAEITDTAPEIVAQHYAQAGKARLAVDYWVKAARQASARSAFVEASTHLELALKQLVDLPASVERDNLELQLQQLLGNA